MSATAAGTQRACQSTSQPKHHQKIAAAAAAACSMHTVSAAGNIARSCHRSAQVGHHREPRSTLHGLPFLVPAIEAL
jgi:hypothetical protein